MAEEENLICENCGTDNVVSSLELDSHWECLECGLITK